MTLKIGSANSANTNFPLERSTANQTTQPKPPVQSAAQNREAINHLTNRLAFGAPDTKPKPKEVTEFMREVLRQQPMDKAGKKKAEVLVLPNLKLIKERRAADYDTAVNRALFDKAGYPMLTDKELASAVTALNYAFETPKITDQTRGILRAKELKTGRMTLPTDNYTIEAAKRAGQAALGYSEYQAQQVDQAIEKGSRETNNIFGGFVQPIVNAPVNVVNGISEPFRAGERVMFGTNHIPEIPRLTAAENSAYWQKNGRMYANTGAEIGATLLIGGVSGARAMASQTGRALLGIEAIYNGAAGVAGKDVTHTDEQGNARKMPIIERGLRIAGGALGARQTINAEIAAPNSIANRTFNNLNVILGKTYKKTLPNHLSICCFNFSFHIYNY